jgi:SAM-dependent methyltransferase
MLARGACLVSTDISEEMMRLAAEKFQSDTDFHVIPGKKSDIRVEEFLATEFDLEAHLKDSIGFNHETDRAVIGRLANNESLPFKSDSFDCYLACLSLMLVDNHVNMLEEAFRVC